MGLRSPIFVRIHMYIMNNKMTASAQMVTQGFYVDFAKLFFASPAFLVLNFSGASAKQHGLLSQCYIPESGKIVHVIHLLNFFQAPFHFSIFTQYKHSFYSAEMQMYSFCSSCIIHCLSFILF